MLKISSKDGPRLDLKKCVYRQRCFIDWVKMIKRLLRDVLQLIFRFFCSCWLKGFLVCSIRYPFRYWDGGRGRESERERGREMNRDRISKKWKHLERVAGSACKWGCGWGWMIKCGKGGSASDFTTFFLNNTKQTSYYGSWKNGFPNEKTAVSKGDIDRVNYLSLPLNQTAIIHIQASYCNLSQLFSRISCWVLWCGAKISSLLRESISCLGMKALAHFMKFYTTVIAAILSQPLYIKQYFKYIF